DARMHTPTIHTRLTTHYTSADHNESDRSPPFFLYCPGDHRDLHSFPTRRSSDLRSRWALQARSRQPISSRCWSRPTGWHATKSRSEEHTSELQSRENLVCRLLLEKKNT